MRLCLTGSCRAETSDHWELGSVKITGAALIGRVELRIKFHTAVAFWNDRLWKFFPQLQFYLDTTGTGG
jgi:hypothetical protein